MSIISKLASSLGRRDELPNQELARELAESKDKDAIKELVTNLDNKNSNIQSDCIKVLYEIGEQDPSLIAGYAKEFVRLLEHKNNRMVWGAMTALDTIAALDPKTIYPALPAIVSAGEKGSVITRDHAVNILIKLAANSKYSAHAFPLLMEQLRACPVNQLPMYAENALPVIDEQHKNALTRALSARLAEVEKESKRKRIEKVLRKLSK